MDVTSLILFTLGYIYIFFLLILSVMIQMDRLVKRICLNPNSIEGGTKELKF